MRVFGPESDEDVRRYAGQWVAVKDGRVVFGSSDPDEVWDWLNEHQVGEVQIVRIPGPNEPKVWMLSHVA